MRPACFCFLREGGNIVSVLKFSDGVLKCLKRQHVPYMKRTCAVFLYRRRCDDITRKHWVQRTGDKFPEWPGLHPLLFTDVCAAHFTSPHTHTHNNITFAQIHTAYPQKQLVCFVCNRWGDTQRCRRIWQHSLVYLYHELWAVSYSCHTKQTHLYISLSLNQV